ncbi:ribonuclease R [Ectothiorhodospira lacustris]|uniref:ribonuclease R n=1 Tax=Ectothiorhodospira lacustris TaxID=2899127 RepID=UPI001EE806C3|nr:ribonuclease R [Ectothiorhodospira lacustris]MCG5510920.1 ribonuclease R [Ectothiorhodospira lacustris]MCG5522652.1 ribonuclease R [Ectothiorhodospira lacustris]
MTKKKKSLTQDPHFEREARKYERPIPSRELILQVVDQSDGPISFDPLARRLGLEEEVDQEALRRRLRAMERDGQLVCNRAGGWLPVNQSDLVRGRIIGHPDGFGFLVPDEPGEDLFLSPRQMRALIHGDRAVARVIGIDRRGRREGAIIEVLERNTETVVGRLAMEGGIGFVAPDNKRMPLDVLIPPECMGEARPGQIVTVRIKEQPTKRTRPIGEVIEVLGEHMAPGMEIDIAVRAHGLPFEWPDAVQEAIKGFSDKVPREASEWRLDLRDMPLVTIDGEDSRDFDDAVYCESLGRRGYKLWVAIADVAYYVRPGDPLDMEARHRGTSVYFPERVIPMLPEVLSNGLCSLNPEVDRLCLACEMTINSRGRIKDAKFHQAVMRSHARLTYTEVAEILVEQKAETIRRRESLVPHLEDLYGLYKLLRKARDTRGTVDFETTETRILFGADRKIERIVAYERNDAHKIIEECMIAANVATAGFLKRKRMPTLYRVHEGPKPSKLEDLRRFLGELGLSLRGGDEPTPADFSALLEQVKARPDARLVQTALLRSLSQAVYAPDNLGHFGLAHEEYLHFTSPIRRYPDLLVHRAIHHVLDGGKPKDFCYAHIDMVALGESCSMRERRADEASWDVTAWLKCEYMLDKVGEVFDGVVTSVTSFGLFIELKDIYVEGLVHVTSLSNDYYHFDPAGHRLSGERSGRVYRLGDPVRVKVARVDLDERKIDFVPEESGPGEKRGRSEDGEGRKSGRNRRRKGRKPESEAATVTAPSAAADEAGEPAPASGRRRRRSNRKTADTPVPQEAVVSSPPTAGKRPRKKDDTSAVNSAPKTAKAAPAPALPAEAGQVESESGEKAKSSRRRRRKRPE